MQTPELYAASLYRDGTAPEIIRRSRKILQDAPDIVKFLSNPVTPKTKKIETIEKYFSQQLHAVLCELCEENKPQVFFQIADEFEKILNIQEKSAAATLYYTVLPSEEEIEALRQMLRTTYGKQKIDLTLTQDMSLIGGYILQMGDVIYDKSIKSSLERIKQNLGKASGAASFDPSEIISLIREEISEYDGSAQIKEFGYTTHVGDGIAMLYGLDSVVYGEIIHFETGVKGMVQNIEKNGVGCILFGKEDNLTEGVKAYRTGKRAGIAVSDALMGRVVNALGEPIDAKGEIPASSCTYRPIEHQAPSVIEREGVSVPLQTGILAIDSMVPIGRGQRELIIGDRQTGKTSIALDTILNQKGKDVICIYVAIGQKASTIAHLAATLNSFGALEYTVIVAASAGDTAPMQYLAPYAGAAIGEHFMYQGKNVLIVYDDLSKHAVAYRAISLLLKRPPGREAYPGDVFYLHSRLLERAARLSKKLGGGSMTALPLIETLAGDSSAYIPTNVISITDGQINLEGDLFFSGVRPAVNVGLSVSRVGGAAQTKIMKKLSGSLRIELAQYRELEVFTQFGSDIDKATKDILEYGKILVEVLKQPLHRMYSLAEEIILLYAATKKRLNDVPIGKIRTFKEGLLQYAASNYRILIDKIEAEKQFSDEITEQLDALIADYKKQVSATWQT